MNILLVDDNSLFREALKSVVLHTFPEATISQTESFAAGIKLLKDNHFDLIVIDSDMPEFYAEGTLNSLMRTAENSRVVVVSSSEDNVKIRKLFSLGIRGYISKKANSRIIGNALQLVANGGKYLPSSLLENNVIVQTNGNNVEYSTLNKPLTNRQSQVLNLVAQGKSNKQIAYDMGVSEATVKLHINALLRSLHVTNRTQAVITAQKIGLI